MTAKPAYLTISIDDGHTSDQRSAELLQAAGLKATFYIPVEVGGSYPSLSPDEIKALSRSFEIGGHTYHHLPLAGLEPEKARDEIVRGKQWLEDLCGQALVSFCYPLGNYSRQTIQLVQEAGFLGARTCDFNRTGWPASPFAWGVGTHAVSHSRLIQLRHAVLHRNFQGALDYARVYKLATDWEEHFYRSLDWVSEHGGIAHLYFHSWEIDGNDEWDKLGRALLRTKEYPAIKRVTNGELFRNWSAQRA